jgi:hypothetical protein
VIERATRRLVGVKLWEVNGSVPTYGDDAIALVYIKSSTKWQAKRAFRRRYATNVIYRCAEVEGMTRQEIEDLDVEAMNQFGY